MHLKEKMKNIRAKDVESAYICAHAFYAFAVAGAKG